MNTTTLEKISPFFDEARDLINVIVETPKGSQNKYDYDHTTGLFILDRPIHSSLRYPFDYGFVPNTLALDGDPVDIVLMINQPTYTGCLVRSRVVGVMIMEDEAGRDEKILCVADRDPRTSHITDIEHVPPHHLKELEHFFIHIKDLEKEKWARVEGFQGREVAISVIREGVKNGRRDKAE